MTADGAWYFPTRKKAAAECLSSWQASLDSHRKRLVEWIGGYRP